MCQVCNKDVKHEYTAILNHLRVKHNMTLTHYTQTYRPATTGPAQHSQQEAGEQEMVEQEMVEEVEDTVTSEAPESGQEDQLYEVLPAS